MKKTPSAQLPRRWQQAIGSHNAEPSAVESDHAAKPAVRIPFNRPTPLGDELELVQRAINSGHHSGDGPFTKACSELLEHELDVKKALLTTSCTHALEMTALLLNIVPGDEVIVPSFTFVSSANAFVLRGARPIFADVRPDTLNIDEKQIERLISSRTKAIVVVHYAGVGCEMDQILQIANAHHIPVIEDNAHGLFGHYRGKPLGTFGCMSTLSFHETKNFSCGEGGALLVNDLQYAEQAEIIREKGTNRSQLFRGQVDKYTWLGIGSSYLPSDLLAAYLFGQLERRKEIQRARQSIWENYEAGLRDWACKHEVLLPQIPGHCEQAFHMFHLRMPTLETRQALIEHLRARGILSPFHYLPLHLSAVGKSFGGKIGDCPIAERVSDQIVRLPFFCAITLKEMEEVIAAVRDFTFQDRDLRGHGKDASAARGWTTGDLLLR
jgi:dTDP-4-amino-4,6-dideoxygalactose transaminase